MDKSWYRSLARSTFDGKRWLFTDATEKSSFSDKLQLAMTELRYTAFEAAQIYNHHSPSAAHITTLVMNDDSHPQENGLENGVGSGVRGLMFLRFSMKVRLLLEGQTMIMSLLEIKSYRHHELASTKLMAEEDDLGGIVWKTPSAQIWDSEQLIKSAIKELVKSSSLPQATF